MIPHDKFIDKIKQYIDEKKLFSFGDHVIIGLSGGADSVCLLLVLKRLQQIYNLSITAIHVHHGIRGESAEHDLKFSRQLCEKEEIEFVEKRCDVPALAAKHHLTEEEAGRRVRYETFECEAKKRGASVIAVAHHMDDQAETVLMNLLRGSGIRGCSGIPCKRSLSDKGDIVVVRPLLGMRREAIEAWLIENGQGWCIDETNLTDDYLRSRIRNRLLPLLSSEYNAQAAEHIACAAGDFSEAEEYLRDQAQALISSWNCVLHKQMMLPVKELKLQKPILQRYLIQEAISHTGGVKDITRTHIESVIGLLSKRTGSMVNLPQRRKARIQYEFLIIEKESFSEHKEENQDLQSPNSKIGKAVYSIFPVCEKKIPQTCCVNWFDYDTIKEGLLMRRSKRYEGKTVHMICVLKGGVFFMCELAKRITVPVTMDFMSVSSYGAGTKSSGIVKIVKDLDQSIEGRDVLVVEDIIDSGRTLSHLMKILNERKPSSICLCTLLDKPERREVDDVNVDYTGFQVPDEFVVGYGLDYDQMYRNLPYVGVVETE